MLQLGTFMLLFGPRLQVVDLHIVAVLGLACIGVYVLLTTERRSPTLGLLVAQIPAFAYASLSALRAGGADLTIAWITLKWMLYLLAGIAITELYKRHEGEQWDRTLLRDCLLAGIVNASFVLVMVVSQPVRALASAVLMLDDKGHWVEQGFRGFDLSMGGGASASIVFGVLFVVFLRSGRASGLPLPTVGAAILLAGTVLTGRTGLVVIALGLAVLAALGLKQTSRAQRPAQASRTIAGLVVVALAAGAFIVTSNHEIALHFRDVVLPWALEGLLTDSGGVTGNRSVNTILDEMLFLPYSDLDLVIGSGNAGRSELLRYIPSDVGYVRLLFSVGVVGLCLLIAGYAPCAVLAWRNRAGSPLAFALGFYLVVMTITNFKELHLAPRGGAALLAVCAVGLSMIHGRAPRLARSATFASRAALPNAGAGEA